MSCALEDERISSCSVVVGASALSNGTDTVVLLLLLEARSLRGGGGGGGSMPPVVVVPDVLCLIDGVRDGEDDVAGA